MWRADSFEKTLMLRKIEGRRSNERGWDGWMASLTKWTWVWVNCGSWWWVERPGMLQSMGSHRVGHDYATELNCDVGKDSWEFLKPLHPKINQFWIFTGRTDDEAETPILWPPDVKSQLIRKSPDTKKYWRQEEKGTTGMRLLDGITDTMDMCLSEFWEMVKDREDWHAAVREVAKSLTWLSDWTTFGRLVLYH